MIGRLRVPLLAFGGGALLALMLNYSSILATHTTPTYSSWVAHGLGAVVALALALTASRVFRYRAGEKPIQRTANTPLWMYLGGIPGAFTVILGAITVNGSRSLSGAIAFTLLGQIVFGMVSDQFGWFGIQLRRIAASDFLVSLCVLTGSVMIVLGRT